MDSKPNTVACVRAAERREAGGGREHRGAAEDERATDFAQTFRPSSSVIGSRLVLAFV